MAVLVGVTAVALGADRGILTRLSLISTSGLEQKLVDRLHPGSDTLGEVAVTGAVAWLNSAPLTADSLKGKVVLYDFWTYSCINCLRTLPYLRAWADKYKSSGLLVIGVTEAGRNLLTTGCEEMPVLCRGHSGRSYRLHALRPRSDWPHGRCDPTRAATRSPASDSDPADRAPGRRNRPDNLERRCAISPLGQPVSDAVSHNRQTHRSAMPKICLL